MLVIDHCRYVSLRLDVFLLLIADLGHPRLSMKMRLVRGLCSTEIRVNKWRFIKEWGHTLSLLSDWIEAKRHRLPAQLTHWLACRKLFTWLQSPDYRLVSRFFLWKMAIEKLLLERLYLVCETNIFRDFWFHSWLHNRYFDSQTIRLCFDLGKLLSLSCDKWLLFSKLLPLRNLTCVGSIHLRGCVWLNSAVWPL